jgi:FKBP-type peptidyl-prolyl cis-trans isomerase FkpA
MTTKTLLALAAATVFVAGCGGAPEPSTPAPAADNQQAAPTVDIPTPSASAPSTQTATADKPAPGDRAPNAPNAPSAPNAPKVAPANPGFTRTDLQVGTGREARKGKGVSVHYTGWLYDPTQPGMKGRMFDSSKQRGQFDFVLGAGQVIPGWDQGFDGMKIGGRRRLIIPPSLAYGVDGAGNGVIPPNATLIFEMELLDVEP